MRDEDHGHARNENNSGGAVHVWVVAACDEGGPGFVSARVRTVTNARQVGMRMQSKCAGTHRHVRVGAINTSKKMEQTGTWVHQVARGTEEQLRNDKQELKTRETEESHGCKEDTRDCSWKLRNKQRAR